MRVCLSQGRGAEAAAVRGVHKCGGQQGMLPAAPRCLAGRRRHCPHPHPPWTLALPGQPTGKITSLTSFLRHKFSFQFFGVPLEAQWIIYGVDPYQISGNRLGTANDISFGTCCPILLMFVHCCVLCKEYDIHEVTFP